MASPVDWDLAKRIGRRFAGADKLHASYLLANAEALFEKVSAAAVDLVAECTKLKTDPVASVRVLNRADWVDENVELAQEIFAPLTQRLEKTVSSGPVSFVGSRLAAAEIGTLLGYVAQKVIGQYNPFDPKSDGCLYYIGPNIIRVERKYGFDPEDFRLWIALHELTHRAQFTGVPWIRDYFLGLAHEILGMVEPDHQRIVRALRKVNEAVKLGKHPLDDGGIVGLLASDEQRVSIDKIQALMSIVEGHGVAVMNRLGAHHVKGAERMAAVFAARRAPTGVAREINRLLGFEQKMRQYSDGERFLSAVESQAGWRALDNLWVAPANIPTLEEISSPADWLERINP